MKTVTLVNAHARAYMRIMRQSVNISLPSELVQKARELGLNISKIAENSLSNYITSIEQGFSAQTETFIRARSLVRTKTLASGAGDRGFESHRARQESGELTLDREPLWGIREGM